jgi:hypothetical protein
VEVTLKRNYAQLFAQCESSFIYIYIYIFFFTSLRIVRKIALGHAIVQSFHNLQIISNITEANWQNVW